MPITSSALKKQRVDKKRTQVNRTVRSKVKSAVKKALSNPELSNIKKAYAALDRAAKKGIIKKEKASRSKSLIVKRSKQNSESSPFTVKKSSKK